MARSRASEQHEHLLLEIVSHLKPGGLLVVAVPNFSSLQQFLFSRFWFHLDLPRHLVHFDSKWIKKNLQNNGLTVQLENHIDLVQNGYGFIQSSLNVINSSRPNHFYHMLKFEGGLKNIFKKSFFIYCLLSVLLLPFAILDCIIGALFRIGASIQIVSKLENK